MSVPVVAARHLEQAVPLTGSSLAGAAAWKDGELTTPAQGGEPLAVTLHLDRARVYAYQVELCA